MTANGPTPLDYLEFSELAYDLTFGGTTPTVPIPEGFQVLDVATSMAGLNAVAFVNEADHEVVLAYRGTDTQPFNKYDLGQDIQILTGHRPADFNAAEDFAATWLNDPALQGYTFYVTGHSLGAAEAEDVAARFQLPGATFGGAGVTNLLAPGTPTTDAQPLVDYVIPTDAFGTFATDTTSLFGDLHLFGKEIEPGGVHVGTVELLTGVGRANYLLTHQPIVNEDKAAIFSLETVHKLPSYGAALLAAGLIPENANAVSPIRAAFSFGDIAASAASAPEEGSSHSGGSAGSFAAAHPLLAAHDADPIGWVGG